MPERSYVSYLLRLRQMRNDTETLWVASVQSTATGEQLSFSSVQALVRFLQTEYGERQTCAWDAELKTV